MIEEIQHLTEQYFGWLNAKTNMRSVDEWVEITTPYLDRHNDKLQIYVKRSNGGFVITDDSTIIDDLELSGCKLSSPKRQSLLRMTLNGFGVSISDNELHVSASSEDFAQKKHNLLQAMLAVNDLFYLATPMVTSLFYEDVVSWLDDSDIRYTPNVKFSGKSDFDHRYDFVIPRSRTHPERILLSINRPDRANTQRAVFAWEDTREMRSGASLAYALLNDTERPIPESILTAFRNYAVHPVPWKARDSVREELAA